VFLEIPKDPDWHRLSGKHGQRRIKRPYSVAPGRVERISPEEQPFHELPQAMIEYLLSESSTLSSGVHSSFTTLLRKKKDIREEIQSAIGIRNDRDLPISDIPTICGVDGSYLVERLLAIDFTAWAAIIVEGLTPPSEKRYWPEPRFVTRVRTSSHYEETQMVVRATMISAENQLAVQAPHDIVLLDGSITTPTIYLNQGLAKLKNLDTNVLATDLIEQSKIGILAYRDILQSERTDKIFAYIPKYSTRREIGQQLSSTQDYDDRALLSMILNAGEFIGPVSLRTEQEWHIGISSHPQSSEISTAAKEITEGLNSAVVFYYKPSRWSPALRIETNRKSSRNESSIASLLKGIEYQMKTPAILEPYPLYLADRMVHHLSAAIPAVRRAATQETAIKCETNMNELFISMNAYRTE